MTTEGAHDLERLPVQHVDELIRAVVDEQKLLPRVDGKPHIPDRPAAERVLRNHLLANERAVLHEHLQPIVRAVADVDQSVLRDAHGMHDAELGSGRSVRVVLARLVLVLHGAAERTRQFFAGASEPPIVGPVAVRAPMPLVGAGRSVEHDDTMVHVAVRHIDLVGSGVDREVRRRAEVLGVVAARARALAPDLHQELPRACELQDVCILVASGAQPYVVRVVDVDTVLKLRPLIASARTAPRREQRAVGVELQHRRRRFPDGPRFIRLKRGRTMGDPDVVACVHGDSGNGTENPVIGQRLWPRGIDAECRDSAGRSARLRERPLREGPHGQ